MFRAADDKSSKRRRVAQQVGISLRLVMPILGLHDLHKSTWASPTSVWNCRGVQQPPIDYPEPSWQIEPATPINSCHAVDLTQSGPGEV